MKDESRPSSTTASADDAAAPPSRAVGTMVGGKYRVERILGRGGMGVVLGARHVALDERVAIKLMSRDAAKDATAAERFLREARASLKIRGEHVVRVIDVGTDDGVPFLVMEHLEGSDLATLLADRGPLSIHDVVLFTLQACEALAEAHAQGIVHRDIKPSNLFLATRPDGTPLIKVLDFGIAKALRPDGDEPSASLTDTHAVFGSPAYMSPEQIRSAKNVDARTDIWALGIVMHELLTGQHPFGGESSAAVIASVSADRPQSVRMLRGDVPPELALAIERCLEKDPEKRVPNVLELALSIAPFAPAGELSTDRIRRVSARAAVRRSITDTVPAPISSGSAMSPPWATTSPKKPEGRSWRTLAIAVVVSAAVGAGLALMMKPEPKPKGAAGAKPAATTKATTPTTKPTAITKPTATVTAPAPLPATSTTTATPESSAAADAGDAAL